MRIYTTGYLGDKVNPGDRKTDRIVQLVEELDAVLCDIRLVPWSQAPLWRKATLEKLLGDRYRHVQALGNLNYRNGEEILIKNMEQGIKEVLSVAPKNALLLCGCEKIQTCHRLPVVKALCIAYDPHMSGFGEITHWGKFLESMPAA